MADNVAITAGSGTNIATDDDGGVHYQEVKIMAGADGTFTGDVAGRTVDGGSGAALYVDPRPKAVRLAVTPTISSGAVYAAKDAIGALMTFSNAARASGGSIWIDRVQVLDKGQQMATLDLVLFDRTLTAPTDNAAFDPTDAELATAVAVVPIIAADYKDFNDNSLADRPVGVEAVLNGTDLFGVLVARSTPTYTSTSDIVVTLTLLQD